MVTNVGTVATGRSARSTSSEFTFIWVGVFFRLYYLLTVGYRSRNFQQGIQNLQYLQQLLRYQLLHIYRRL